MSVPALFGRLSTYLPQLMDGALTTLGLSVVATLGGFVGGVALHMMSIDRSALLRRTARVYVSAIRGTPVLTQLLVLYYLPSALGLDIPGTAAAAAGLALNTAAYQSQILGTGFRAIPRGQIEAASTFNLSRRQTLWHIEVPQVVAMTLPALVSEMIDIVKASAVVSVIAVTDLMRAAQQLSSSSYRPLEVYTFAACFYLATTSLLAVAARCHERHRQRPA
ncbi:polar amino acid transport system permease protein [Paraburkholderia tropica]|uniref:amino acid ABC transporter permease n=1 Tax=Paraburkholderia tropica TaxID=92647 RepID=UPI00160A9F34|nr:amino acid ABC transporter permease [Paraburkholderia tropica]MBB3003529.1 polar amino acid transport system permease protein [Paraburkholderia tropica]MBB6322561.1 polar amino acid transport system permease protein [Paraburkholderia tropica]